MELVFPIDEKQLRSTVSHYDLRLDLVLMNIPVKMEGSQAAKCDSAGLKSHGEYGEQCFECQGH